jgi:hypothetical protein
LGNIAREQQIQQGGRQLLTRRIRGLKSLNSCEVAAKKRACQEKIIEPWISALPFSNKQS